MSFAAGFMIFRLVVWAIILAWIDPRVLDRVGAHAIAVWLKQHFWVRVLGVPPLGLLAIITAFEVRDDPRQRERVEALARSAGGTVIGPPRMDPMHGLPDGPRLRVPLGDRALTVSRWKRRSRTTTIARLEMRGVSGFAFVARDAGNEGGPLRGLQQAAIGMAVDPLGLEPIAIGHDRLDRTVVLCSNRPAAARALFSSSEVAAAIEAMSSESGRWSCSLTSTGDADASELQIQCPGALADADSLGRVVTLARATLEQLSAQGLLAA